MGRPRGLNGVLVAAASAPGRIKAWADYVCDGVDDQVEIQAALDAAGRVYLSPGDFQLSQPVILRGSHNLTGAGLSLTRVNAIKDGVAKSCFRWHNTPKFQGTATGGGATTITFAGDQRAFIAAGDMIRIKRGTGAGQRRTVSGVAYASGTTTVTTSGSAWSPTPSTDSVCVVQATADLFCRLSDMVVRGWKYMPGGSGNNQAYTGSVVSHSNGVVVTSASVPTWAIGNSFMVTSGAAMYEFRHIDGLATTSQANDTILLDGPLWDDPSGATFAVVAHGLYVPSSAASAFDMQLERIWFANFTGAGLYTESGWGLVCNNVISEVNDVAGVVIEQPPSAMASTGTWKSTAGQTGTICGKWVNCKILGNRADGAAPVTGDGLIVHGRCFDGRFAACEFGSDNYNGAGVRLHGAYGASVELMTFVGCTFSSWDTIGGSPQQSCIRLKSAISNVVKGCTARLSTSVGAINFSYIDGAASQGNVFVGNTISGSSGVNPFAGSAGSGTQDGSGWNLYRGNLVYNTFGQDSFCGIVSAAANASGEVTYTYPASLMNLPTAADWNVQFSPADATTASVPGWYVSAVSKTSVTIKSAAAVTGVAYTFYVEIKPECRRTGNA